MNTNELKIVEGSKFFKVENGKLYFHFMTDDYMIDIEGCNKHIKNIIVACACYEWYEYMRNYMSYRNNYETEQFNLSTDQIKLWKKWGEE